MANPFLEPIWDTPFQAPPFDRITDDDWLPAFQDAMKRSADAMKALTTNPDPPTFDNTIAAMERALAILWRVEDAFYAKHAAHTNDAMDEVVRQMAPIKSAHMDSVHYDRALFARIDALMAERDTLNLTPEQDHLLTTRHKRYLRRGILLPAATIERVKAINAELAGLGAQFADNLLWDTQTYALLIHNKADLGTLPEALVAVAAEEARRRGNPGCWAFTLTRPSIMPFLQCSPNRTLRTHILEAFEARGDRSDERDNKAVVARMAMLRAERAQLIGYASHAHYTLEEQMAKDPDNVRQLLDRIWAPACSQARREAEWLAAAMEADGHTGPVTAADWRYYAEQVRRERYDLDEDILRPYFELGSVRERAFDVANRLFGLSFEARDDIPKWHASQLTYAVSDKDGKHLGVLYMDLYARPTKRSGAWMATLRSQSNLDGRVRPLVTTNFNYAPPTDNSPSLLSVSEATTLFHEIGHALHSLLSDVTYPSQAGTNVPRDFVEFPSQILENWLTEPEVLRQARHVTTGEPIPDDLIERLEAAARFNQGFATVEYMAAAFLDLAWHTLGPDARVDDVRAFEEEALQAIGLSDAIPPRYRSTAFAHVFSGGYAAGYYSYMWAQVLDADGFEAFREAGLFDQEVADKYRRLLSRGGSQQGMDLYRAFRGREPDTGALVRRLGFQAPG